ncbi:MAG TPA: lipid II flippase MurJ [Candidatus Paceibacterota bacterium]|nr:lipid II flippase MurJ [Candidatus Paceibacterota bacterium]
MEKILKIFSKEYENLNQAAILLGFFAFLSQILGLFRDRALAHFIGPSPMLDSYYAAFRIPDLIFISIASLASITVLIPFILRRMSGEKITIEAQKFLNDVFTVFLAGMVLVSAIFFIFMPEISPYIAPGFTSFYQEKVTLLSRIMLLSPILLGLSNLFGSVTQLFRRFFLYSLSPIFYNVGIIIGVVLLYPLFGIQGLGLGVVLGSLLHFLIQVFASATSGFMPRFSLNIDYRGVWEMILVSMPRTLGLSFNNIALTILVMIASYLTPGSISIFNLSLSLQSVPLGIVGLSYAVAAFPTLTKYFSKGMMSEFKEQLKSAARQIIFWSLPATFLFIVLRAQIVRVVLGSSNFSWENTRLVAAALAVFAISVTAQGLVALFARAYYAAGNTRKPLLINLISASWIVFFAIIFNYAFSHYPIFQYFIESLLKVSDIPGTEVLILPLAYSFGTIINLALLGIFLKKEYLPKEEFVSRTFFHSLGASFLIGAVTYFFLNILSPIFGTTTFWGVFLQGFFSGIFGIAAGVIVLHLLRNRELADLVAAFKTKFWKSKVIVPPQEEL